MKIPQSWIKLQYAKGKTFKSYPADKLCMDFSRDIKLETSCYYDAIVFNARAIADHLKNPCNVLLSGGVDSEVIVRINKDLGIKQKVYTFQFEDNYNIRDVESAKDICKNLGIPLNIIQFDLKKFFEHEAEGYYKKTYSPRVELLPRLKWHEYFDSPLIFGDGEPYLRRSLGSDYSQNSDWTMTFSEHEFFHMIYTNYIERNAICPWYQFTPEIHGNFLKLDIVKKIINDEMVGKQSTFSSKVDINRTIWPDMTKKPKLVGYEGLLNSPGYIPDFMRIFRDAIMKDVKDTEISFSLSLIKDTFK